MENLKGAMTPEALVNPVRAEGEPLYDYTFRRAEWVRAKYRNDGAELLGVLALASVAEQLGRIADAMEGKNTTDVDVWPRNK